MHQLLGPSVALGRVRNACPSTFLFGTFFALAAPLAARQSPKEDPPEEPAAFALLEFLDQDMDGILGRYEGAEAWLHLVDEADSNGDGALSDAELSEFFGARIEDEREEIRSWIEEFDRDGNGGLEARELPRWIRESIDGGFGDLDGDGDGSLSFEELLELELSDPTENIEEEILEFLAEVDIDGDGAFTLEELSGDLPEEELNDLTQFHRELDRDGDGSATREELLEFAASESMDAAFEVRGQNAHMRGVIGPSTPARVLELILEHPDVTTIILDDVPGSKDDHANLRASRLVRKAELGTLVPRDGIVASGGTDFFLAGRHRRAPEGARLGVHSWGGPEGPGNEQPRDDPSHQLYLDYYREMSVPGEFYWFTLDAAPQESIHWMSREEIQRFGMLTDEAPGPKPDGRGPTDSDSEDASYGLDDLETAVDPRGIVLPPDPVHPEARRTFERDARVTSRKGRPLELLARGRGWSDRTPCVAQRRVDVRPTALRVPAPGFVGIRSPGAPRAGLRSRTDSSDPRRPAPRGGPSGANRGFPTGGGPAGPRGIRRRGTPPERCSRGGRAGPRGTRCATG